MILSFLCNVNALWRDKIKEQPPDQWRKLPRVLLEVQEKERAGDRACQGHHREPTRSQGAVLVMAARVPRRYSWNSPWHSIRFFCFCLSCTLTDGSQALSLLQREAISVPLMFKG